MNNSTPIQLPQTGELRRSITVLRQQTDRLQRILQISQILTSTFDLDQLLHLILSAATELTNTEAASIMLLDEGGTVLRYNDLEESLRHRVWQTYVEECRRRGYEVADPNKS